VIEGFVVKGKAKAARGAMTALGMMSGTSLDGVDAAIIATDGEDVLAIGDSAYRPYSLPERDCLRAAFGRWPGQAGVAEAAEVVETAHAQLLARMGAADDPAAQRTHQTGSGAVLAAVSGRRVVWDFRSNDVAMGGQGAPLAPAFHFALARWIGAVAPLGFLNLGGVGNVTVVDPSLGVPERPGALLAFDTGPANAPIDDLMLARTGAARDEGGAAALAGKADNRVLERLAADPFLTVPPPKSLDRDAFAWLGAAVADLATPDAAATLVEASALCVAAGLARLDAPPERILVGGGGRHNPALMAALRRRLPATVDPVEIEGLNGDMLEAQAFAFLAVRVLRGLPTSFPGTTGVAACIGGGQVSMPEQSGL
jgi:anhydro-N-acetylmuramic acid kinase